MSFQSCGVWQWHKKTLKGGALKAPPTPGIGLSHLSGNSRQKLRIRKQTSEVGGSEKMDLGSDPTDLDLQSDGIIDLAFAFC